MVLRVPSPTTTPRHEQDEERPLRRGPRSFALRCVRHALWATGVAAATLAAAAEPRLEIVPGEVELCPGRARLVRITAKDLAPRPGTTLGWEGDARVAVDPQALPESATPTNGSTTNWLVRLDAEPAGATPGVVHFFVAEHPAGGAASAPLVGSLTVKTPDASKAFPARLELMSAAETLNERQQAVVRALVSNLSPTPMRVDRVALLDDGAPFELVSVVAGPGVPASAPTVVPPWDTRIWTFTLQVGAKARPPAGKHRLVFVADARVAVDGCERSGSVSASRDLGFAVLGESTVLAAMAIPSVLLIPGALFLLAPAVLWRLGLRLPGREQDDKFPLSAGTPEFWTVAITLSIAGYWLAAVLARRGDLFVAYRFEDVVWTWLVSMGAGLLSYGAYRHLKYLRQLIAEGAAAAERTRRSFTRNDDPVTTLGRLALRQSILETEQTSLDLKAAKLGTGQATVHVLERADGQAWIAAPIRLDLDALDAESQQAIERARKADDLPGLVASLERSETTRQAVVWADAGFPSPIQVADDALPPGNKFTILRLKGPEDE